MMRRALGRDRRGFTLAEVIIASMVLLIALLVIGTMFPVGHRQVVDAGRMTLAVTAGRQVLEDIGSLPFASVVNMNNFNTANVATLPAANPELAVARRIRFMVAGAGNGFNFTAAELAEYGSFTPIGGQATIQVTQPSGTLRQVTVTVSVPGLTTNVQLSTVVVSLF
jgi:prepilin-type N-terminal cleavage/methylation domain-containing protein